MSVNWEKTLNFQEVALDVNRKNLVSLLAHNATWILMFANKVERTQIFNPILMFFFAFVLAA